MSTPTLLVYEGRNDVEQSWSAELRSFSCVGGRSRLPGLDPTDLSGRLRRYCRSDVVK